MVTFEVTGIVITGNVEVDPKEILNDRMAAIIGVYQNNQLSETVELPYSYNTRRDEIFFKYQLPKMQYQVRIKVIDLPDNGRIKINDAILYSDTKVDSHY